MLTDPQLLPHYTPQAVSLAPPPLQPSFMDELGAAFHLNNPIASTFADQGPTFDEASQAEPNFDIKKQLVGTKYEPFLDQAWHIMNTPALVKWQRQVDRETADREVMDASGLTGTGLGMVASVLDPSIFLPGGALVKGAKGYSVLKSALLTGTAGAGAMTLQEAALQSTQEIRPIQESAFAIGGGFLVGALLGAGGAAMLGRVESHAMAREIDRVANSVIPDEQAANEAMLRNAVGAASRPELTIADLTPTGRIAPAMAKVGAMVRLNVASRLLTSESPVVRELGFRLAGNHVYLKMFERGDTLGTPINQALKRWTASSRGAPMVYKSLSDNYKAFRKGGGVMTLKQFAEQVGDAAFRGGQHTIPFVAAVAKDYRVLDDAMFKEASAVGWNMRPQTDDESHAMRIWPQHKIQGNEVAFKVTAAQGYADMTRTAMHRANENRLKLVNRLRQRQADMALGPEDAARLIGELPKQLAALEAQHPAGEATRQQMRSLIGQRNRAPTRDIKSALNYQIQDLKAQAGAAYADYATQRAALRSRFANIKKSIGAGINKEEAIRDQILDMAIGNVGKLERLHTSLSKLDQRMLSESPDAYLAELSKARTDFATLLEKNNDLEVKLATARAEADLAKREAASVAQPAMEARKEKLAQQLDVKQTADQKQIEKLTQLAVKIEDMAGGDPERAVRELQELARQRMEQVAGRIEKEGARIAKKLGERPSEVAAQKVAALDARIADINKQFEELVTPSGGFLEETKTLKPGAEEFIPIDKAKTREEHLRSG